MAWFFTEKNIFGNNYTLVGENAKHISKVLRMRTGEDITLISPNKTQYECKISLITQGEVTVDIISQKPCENEPDVFVTTIRLCLRVIKWISSFRNARNSESAELCR